MFTCFCTKYIAFAIVSLVLHRIAKVARSQYFLKRERMKILYTQTSDGDYTNNTQQLLLQ